MSTELVARLPLDDLGGARVFRSCVLAGREFKRDAEVPMEVLRQIPRTNLRALLDQRFLVAYPKPRDAAPVEIAPAEVRVYQRPGTSRYDVVSGTKLNSVPLSRAEADKLAESARVPAA